MLDADKINILIKEGEGLTVECKERYTPKIDRDIVAFTNSKGGLLLLGVDDGGKVVGEKLTNKMKAEINAIARNCDPLIQFNEAVAFLKKHLNVRSEIRGFDRFDIYEIPLDALREAVVNAIVHRDYRIKGTSIYVRIYDDRVEIENPGGLPDGITRQDFGKSSVRRNPIIADLFHRMGKVERMGSGIERMRELMRDAGLKEPVFEMDAFFRVTFYRDPRYSLKADRFQKAGKKDGEAGEKSTEKILREVGEKVGEKLTKNRQKIIDYMLQNKNISAKELAELVGISQRKMEENISWLKEKGLIKRIGPDKGGYWEIVNG